MAVVACMDARLDPARVLGLKPGDCGMTKFSGEQLLSDVERETGIKPRWAVETFTDLDAAVARSMVRVRSSPFLPAKVVRGFVYDVATGALREVGASS